MKKKLVGSLPVALLALASTTAFSAPVTAVFGVDQNGTAWQSPLGTVSQTTSDSVMVTGFTVNGATYSTGVNDGLLPAGSFQPALFRALMPVHIDKTAAYPLIGVARNLTPPVANSNPPLAPYLTDGTRGLELSTALFNAVPQNLDFPVTLSASALAITAPFILSTQMGAPGTLDVYNFVDSNGNTVGNDVKVVFNRGIGTINWQFRLPSGTASTLWPPGARAIQMAAFTLADFGLTTTNIGSVVAFRQRLNGASDPAFVAYNETVVTVAAPDMTIDLSGLPAPALNTPYAGSYACRNQGPADATTATSCTVSSLPDGLSVGACTIDTAVPPANWSAGQPVPSGRTVTCAVTGTPITAGQSVVVQGRTDGSSAAAVDSHPENNSATLSLTVGAAPLADMQIDNIDLPAGTIGQPYNGSFVCRNHGPGVAAAATCAPTGLPGWAQPVCTPNPPATLAAGAAISCTVTGTPDAKGSTPVTVRTGATQESDITNNEGTATLVVGGTPDVTIDLSGLPTTGTVNQPYTGHFSCTNQGTADATATVCSATLAPWMTLGACTLSPASNAWTSPSDIPEGQTVTCEVSGTPTQAGLSPVTGTGGTNTATTTVTVAGVAVPVPTLGQWGLVLLAGLLAAFGLRGSGRRTD